MSRRRAAPRFDDKRPPVARLESLVSESSKERKHRIFRRILTELEVSVLPGPWIAAARSMQRRGIISTDLLIYFAEMFLECVTSYASEHDAELLRLYDELHRVERNHGLKEGETWYVDEAPAEWTALNAEWDRRSNAIRVARLREMGDSELADLLEKDPREFEISGAVGHQELWGAVDGDEDQE
jgi:hypothetical protein